MKSHPTETGRKGPIDGLGNIGRSQCHRHRKCRAMVCPFEPWNRNRKRKFGERLCYFLREAGTVRGTTRGDAKSVGNPNAADEARAIATSISRSYVNNLSEGEYRSVVKASIQ